MWSYCFLINVGILFHKWNIKVEKVFKSIGMIIYLVISDVEKHGFIYKSFIYSVYSSNNLYLYFSNYKFYTTIVLY